MPKPSETGPQPAKNSLEWAWTGWIQAEIFWVLIFQGFPQTESGLGKPSSSGRGTSGLGRDPCCKLPMTFICLFWIPTSHPSTPGGLRAPCHSIPLYTYGYILVVQINMLCWRGTQGPIMGKMQHCRGETRPLSWGACNPNTLANFLQSLLMSLRRAGWLLL